jgi:Ni/Co efflux regulator RcnB
MNAGRCMPIISLLLLALATLAWPATAAAEAQKDTNACLRTSNTLYKRGEELHKKRRWEIPREFGRVASDLDQYCRDKEFKKADIAIDWLNTCLRNYDKPYDQGYCSRSKKYFCAIDAASEACRTSK